jgi:hypothetical protein
MPFKASKKIVEFPVSVCPKHPFTVFDTWHSLHSSRLAHKLIHNGAESYTELFKKLINIGLDTGAYLNIYIDPLDVVKIPRFKNMLDILSDIKILVVTYQEYLSKGLYTHEAK